MVNKVVFGSKLCSSFSPTHVVERFKTEIDAHAEAKADAANATDVAAETEAEEKVPLYLLLLPTATYTACRLLPTTLLPTRHCTPPISCNPG